MPHLDANTDLDTGPIQAVVADPALYLTACLAERAGNCTDVAAMVLQRGGQMFPSICRSDLRRHNWRCHSGCDDGGGQVLGTDRTAARQHHCRRKAFLELAHVERPVVPAQRAHRLELEPHVAVGRDAAQKGGGEQAQILASLANGRDGEAMTR
jgi:hypothetical protein